ncbi:glycosyltransferase family 4 protein [Enterocloster bolteae]|uniref:glycosyltransferase family 4 protein n=1 Tax=Enterocloster bolteae TaxID=208479 RepID=UPI0018A0A133|nr:glycosyltransferase family 1 protein [Enterocloster bolteae]
MKVAVDLSFIRPDHTNGGTESCIKNLMAGWIQQGVVENFLFFIHDDIYAEYKRIFPQCQYKVYKCRGNHKMRTTWFQTVLLPAWVKAFNVDVVYYPTYTTGYYHNISVPVVVNPHDIQFKFYPEYFSELKKIYLDFGYRHSLKKADRIIAISDYVKGTLIKHYGKECGEKIQTIYDPVNFEQRNEERLELVKEPYILSVSSIAKHKNMITLVKAFERVCHEIPHQLVIVGCKGNGMEEIYAYLKERQLDSRIYFTDYVKDSNIQWLYNHADLYVTTSFYEGFGMTPIEALGRGIPTICSTSTSLPEVTKGMAEYYDPANDDRALAETLLRVLTKGVEKGVRPDKDVFIEEYDKTKIAEKLYRLFEELI